MGKKKISISVICNKCGKKLNETRINWNWENAVQYRLLCRNCHYSVDLTIHRKIKKQKII